MADDWDKAIEILDGEGLMPMNTGTIGAIAAALAEERRKARAPFLAAIKAYDDGRLWSSEVVDRFRHAGEVTE